MLIMAATSLNICAAGALYRPLRRTDAEIGPEESQPVGHCADLDDKTPEEDSLPDSAEKSRSHQRTGASWLTLLRRLFSELRLRLLIKSYRFSLFCFIGMIFNIIYSCFVIFVIPWAQDCGIEEQRAPFLLSVMGIGSLIARVASGFFVTRKTPVEAVFTFSMVLCSVGLLCAQVETYESFAVSACIVGIGTGINKALGIVLLRKIIGLPNVASGLGMMYLFAGVGDLVGPILAGE